MYPVKAPEEKRLAIAEFVARANDGLRIGNFELDFGDGEVRYKRSAWIGENLSPNPFASLGYTFILASKAFARR